MEGSLFLARPIKITMSGIEIKKKQHLSLSFVRHFIKRKKEKRKRKREKGKREKWKGKERK